MVVSPLGLAIFPKITLFARWFWGSCGPVVQFHHLIPCRLSIEFHPNPNPNPNPRPLVSACARNQGTKVPEGSPSQTPYFPQV